jgi:hypothetical protein
MANGSLAANIHDGGDWCVQQKNGIEALPVVKGAWSEPWKRMGVILLWDVICNKFPLRLHIYLQVESYEKNITL